MCGLGIIKRKVDSLQWNLTSLDRDAENTRTIATYNKGNNMMICLANYIITDNPSESGIPGIPQKDDPSINDVWLYLRNVFNERHIVTVVDIEYLMHIIKEARLHSVIHLQNSLPFSTNSTINIDIPAIPAASSQLAENDPISELPLIEMIHGITTRVTGRVSSVRCDLSSKRGKRGKTAKRTSDGDWKQPRSKRLPRDDSKPPSTSKTNEVELFAETEVIWGVDVGILKRYPIDANQSFRSIPSSKQRFIAIWFSSSFTFPTQPLLVPSKWIFPSGISITRSIGFVCRSCHTTPRAISSTPISSHLNITTFLLTFQFSYELFLYQFPKSIS